MNKIRHLILAALMTLAAANVAAKDYQMTLFGIKSDGTTMNTRSIQKAIDYIAQQGGGRLVFTVGRYLTGSIHMRSNVTLHLSEGAILVGSTNPYDYDMELNSWYGLILANKQDNIAITGKGVIEGQGRALANNFLAQACNGIINDPLKLGRVANRPKLIYFRECNNVTVKDITLQNPAFWTQTYDQCTNLVIDGITVHSRAYWNNDGMDIVDCNGALIQNCYVDATDDAICLKSHDAKSLCQNITVRNNKACSSASGIKFGTASVGGFKNIRIVNNTIFDTFRSAITIQAVDGGHVENIIVDSLRAINTGNPIYLVVGQRRGDAHELIEVNDDTNKPGRSRMDNVHISNVYAEVPATKPDAGYEYEGPTEDNPRNISPSGIVGLENNHITNVSIENVEIVYPGGGDPNYAHVGTDELDKVPEMPRAYPEFSQHKELPAWGFYVRHADGVTFRNVRLTARKADYRPAIVLDDVSRGSFTKIKVAEPKAGKKQQIFAHNSKQIKK